MAGFHPTQSQLQGFGGQFYSMLDPMKIAELRSWFTTIDADKSGRISLAELQKAQFGGRTLELATAKTLLRMFDQELSGQIGFFEFAALHQFVTWAIGAFMMFDADSSGKLSQRELAEALRHAGFQFTESTMDVIYKKFQTTPGFGAAAQLTLNQFLRVCAYLGQIRASFWILDSDRDGVAQFNLESLVQVVSKME